MDGQRAQYHPRVQLHYRRQRLYRGLLRDRTSRRVKLE
jgi:hypothetical protein